MFLEVGTDRWDIVIGTAALNSTEDLKEESE
jgi:hypothetical protein